MLQPAFRSDTPRAELCVILRGQPEACCGFIATLGHDAADQELWI
jgi:hypothetical protein